MTRSIYIVGGAGVGKSTFTSQLLGLFGQPLGPLEDIYTKPNSRGTQITLRGHRMGELGLYLGCMRDSFPGTDGLDRVSYIPGEEWLELGKHGDYDFILGEGATLSVRRFIRPLLEKTELLFVHLVCDEMIKELRLAERGTGQDPKFIAGTATRSANLAQDMRKLGANVLEVETSNPLDWEMALDICYTYAVRRTATTEVTTRR